MQKILGDLICVSPGEGGKYLEISYTNNLTYLYVPEHMAMPSLLHKLSTTLAAKVVTMSYASVNGAVHYSVVENGELKQVYTYIDGLVEKENISLVEVFNFAVKNGSFRLPSGFNPKEEDLEYGSEEYLSFYSRADLLNIARQSEGIDWERIYLSNDIDIPEYGTTNVKLTWAELINLANSR